MTFGAVLVIRRDSSSYWFRVLGYCVLRAGSSVRFAVYVSDI